MTKDVDKLRDQCDYLSKERESLATENKKLKTITKEQKEEIAILKQLLIDSKAEIKILKDEVHDYKATEMTVFANHHKYAAALKELDMLKSGPRKITTNNSYASARESAGQPDLSGTINYENRSRSVRIDPRKPPVPDYLLLDHKNATIHNSRNQGVISSDLACQPQLDRRIH